MATNTRRRGIEWVGGIVSMPAYVTGEGEPYRPEALFWMNADGAMLGHRAGKPGTLLARAADILRDTIERPMWGPARAPSRVRVASPELAAALRAGHPTLEVVCAPTPEIDAALASLREALAADADDETSYLSPKVGPDHVASFFRAAAALFRAKPWEIVPGDNSLFRLTIEALGVRGAVVSVIGQMGHHLGLVLFADLDDYEAFVDAADAIEEGDEPALPPHVALNFERGAELSPALRKEIAEHGWEVAAADAYPWLVAVDEDLVVRPTTAEELTLAEALALALTEVLGAREALDAAWDGDGPFAQTLSVRTHVGELEVTLQAPYERVATELRPPYDVLAALRALDQDGEELDPDALGPLEDELMRSFAASPEAASLTELGACRMIMDFGADHFGATIATLGPSELREIVFAIIPRKVLIEAEAARSTIEQSRAFYAFLKRELELPQAEACLRVLGGKAVAKLEAALSDSSNFGMGKSLVVAGRDAGYDTSTEAGLQAWMRAIESRPLPVSFGLPSFGEPPRAPKKAAPGAKARAKKKGKRTATSKARKKNR
ncbi:MAG: hypothetical protein IT371_12080 [Deltaproteobacteria bacterium]|nr:hypothetical protein [Deltaproteobacteria bacterium]